MTEYVELHWGCTSCGVQGIQGRFKACPSCSSPREKDEMNMGGLKEAEAGLIPAVTDKDLLSLASAGADWFCRFCAAGNRGDGDCCEKCGGLQREPEAPKPQPAPPVRPRYEPAAPPRDESIPTPLRGSNQPGRPIVAGCAGPIGCIVLIGSIFLCVGVPVKEVQGEVSGLRWQRTVEVDAWLPTTVREWQHKAVIREGHNPVNGLGEVAGLQLIEGSCGQEHYENERYVCGSHEESYSCPETESYTGTCSESERYACGKDCKSMGNGFAKCSTRYCSRTVSKSCRKTRTIPKTCRKTVPDYCTRAIYKTKCGYQTQAWKRVNTLTENGRDEQPPRWPEYTAKPLERTQRSALYEMTVSYAEEPGAQLESFTKDLAEKDLATWTLHRPVTVKFSTLGNVTDFSPSSPTANTPR